MRHYVFPIIIIGVMGLLLGCIPEPIELDPAELAPTELPQKPYVTVSSQFAAPGDNLNESGYGFEPGAMVALVFIKPDGEAYPEANRTADAAGNVPHHYVIRPDQMPGWYEYYALYYESGNPEVQQTDSVHFWITNPTLTPNTDSIIASQVGIRGSYFTPNHTATVQIEFISASVQGGIDLGSIHEQETIDNVAINSQGEIECCMIQPRVVQRAPLEFSSAVRFSVTDDETGATTEYLHIFNTAAPGARDITDWVSDVGGFITGMSVEDIKSLYPQGYSYQPGDMLVVIPSDGTVAPGTGSLLDGQPYQVVVSGYYRYKRGVPGEFADAQYSEDNSDQWSIRSNSLALNDIRLEAIQMDVANHIHVFAITGNGQPLNLHIVDSYYRDNEGYLLALIRPQ